FGFGLMSLVAEGCILLRTCQNNDCDVGVATTDKELRKNFIGTPEMVENMMRFIARDVRENLAKLGYKSLDDLHGRADLLEQVWGEHLGLDIAEILPGKAEPMPQQKYEMEHPNHRIDPQRPEFVSIDEKIWTEDRSEIIERIMKGEKYAWEGEIDNEDRTTGAYLSSKVRNTIIEKMGRDKVLEEDSLSLKFNGVAGQSFGAFGMQGMTVKANGANDGVGKSLSGGKIILSAKETDKNLVEIADQNTILGNSALYGATSGELFAAGRAGNRFGDRLSGATAVIDGAGSHACNYMTGGSVAILGSVGDNFASGMSGGEVFVFDEYDELEEKTFEGSKHKILNDMDWETEKRLKGMIQKQFKETGDIKAKTILKDWDNAVKKFKYVDGARKIDDAPKPMAA
ncbi:MAG: glutamate synthase-related protein, partial [Pseudomonadota bacterium]